MQKSKFFTIFIILSILIYIILSQFYLSSFGTIYVYIINPLFFLLLALLMKFFIHSSYNKIKFKKEFTIYILIGSLAYFTIYLLSGFLVGFGKNPYSTSLKGLLLNIISTGLVILFREYIRYKLINNVYKKHKRLIFILLVITFSLLDFNIYLLISNFNIYYLFKQFFYILLPSLMKNILFTYISLFTNYIPALIYEFIYYIALWILPVLPNSPWILDTILRFFIFLILLLYCNYVVLKDNRFNANYYKLITPSRIIFPSIIILLLIWFSIGIFPVKPVGIATQSMYPNLKAGDMVIIKKCNSDDINVQDIIQYKMDGYTIIHRVIEKNQENGEYYFITKGDNNNSEDNISVKEDQLIGKVIFNIPYLALPTVWFHNLNNQIPIDIQTGN